MSKLIKTKVPPSISIRTEIRPGDIGAIIHLHGTLYAEGYGFDHTFEPYVAIPLGEFMNNRTEKDRLWIVEKEKKVMGSVAIVSCPGNMAQLRWLILHPDLQGCGIGRRLVQGALDFCRTRQYESVFLWTIDFLGAALKLYTSAGFRLTETRTHRIWGRELTEERYELKLTPE